MPLSPPVAREELHLRRLELRGFRRSDGLYDIEAHLIDVKRHDLHPHGRPGPLPAGIPVHDMWVRVVVDETLMIRDIEGAIDGGPFADCPAAVQSIGQLRGARIEAGWTARVKALVGKESCTHLVELLIPLGTAAFQTLAEIRMAQPDVFTTSGVPVRINSCYSYASHRALVKLRWPQFHTGAKPNSAVSA